MKDKFKLIFGLLKLVKPFMIYMLIAVLLGVLGHLTATFISILIILALCHKISFIFVLKMIIICAISRGIFRYIEQACNHYIAFKVLAYIRHLIFEKLRELAFIKLDNHDKGNIIAMLTADVELLEVFFAHTISPVLITIVYSIIMLVFIGYYSIYLAVLAFVCYLLMGIFIPSYTYSISHIDGSIYRDGMGKFRTFILESILGKREIIQYNEQTKRFKDMSLKQEELSINHQRLIDKQTIQQVISDSLIVLSIVVGIIMINNNYNLELLIPLIALSSSFGPTFALATLANNLNQVFPCAKRILSLLDESNSLEDVDNDNKEIQFPIILDHLSFNYPNKDKVINDLCYQFEFGKTYGLLGKSGCGKSTLLKLLMRIYQGEGKIMYGKYNIDEINTNYLREHISYVDQETFLFKDSLYNNITLLDNSYSKDEVVKACKQANIHDFIMSLPDGYDSIYNDDLSSGQKQRIGLARAFLRNRPILLLDEPTSRIDSLNEAMLLDILNDIKKDKLIIIVSHRKSSLAICDEILEFDNI